MGRALNDMLDNRHPYVHPTNQYFHLIFPYFVYYNTAYSRLSLRLPEIIFPADLLNQFADNSFDKYMVCGHPIPPFRMFHNYEPHHSIEDSDRNSKTILFLNWGDSRDLLRYWRAKPERSPLVFIPLIINYHTETLRRDIIKQLAVDEISMARNFLWVNRVCFMT